MTMQQLSFFPPSPKESKALALYSFSHNGVYTETARIALEDNYHNLLEETDKFNRQLVSFQANKTEVLHSWMKYREGFSAALVEMLMRKLGVGPGDTVFDPFA